MKQEDYRKNNPNCEETHVTFRVIGNTVNPGKITQIFGIEPSFSYMKGEQFRSYAGILKRPTGIWAMTSEDHIHSTSLEQHFKYLLDVLEPASLHIQELILDPNIEVDFLCYWLSATGHGGPVLSSPLLRRISALCDTLNFDYYGPYEEDDNEDN